MTKGGKVNTIVSFNAFIAIAVCACAEHAM